MGQIARRLAALEARQAPRLGNRKAFEEQVSREAYRRLTDEELERIVSGLRRIRDHYADSPPQAVIDPSAYTALLTTEERDALSRLAELRAEIGDANGCQ